MNPTDPAFPTLYDKTHGPGMDLRTYMATAFVQGLLSSSDVTMVNNAHMPDIAVNLADALIERLNAK